MGAMADKFGTLMEALSLKKQEKWEEAADAFEKLEQLSDMPKGKALARKWAAECREELKKTAN